MLFSTYIFKFSTTTYLFCPGHDFKQYPGVCLDNRKIFRTSGPWTKYLSAFCFSFNKQHL